MSLVRDYLITKRQLMIKQNVQIQPSQKGLSYCGFRVLQSAIRLSCRRKRNYQKRRQYWEKQYQNGMIDNLQLQAAYAAVHSITQGADSLEWRRQNLLKHPGLIV